MSHFSFLQKVISFASTPPVALEDLQIIISTFLEKSLEKGENVRKFHHNRVLYDDASDSVE